MAKEVKKGPEVPFNFHIGGEGGITRRSAPRPFGAAFRALSPLRRCHSKLNESDEN
jgi:hypothetical protein